MNSIEENNKRHEEALRVAEEFKKAGGKVIYPKDDYKGREFKFPEPKTRNGKKL